MQYQFQGDVRNNINYLKQENLEQGSSKLQPTAEPFTPLDEGIKHTLPETLGSPYAQSANKFFSIQDISIQPSQDQFMNIQGAQDNKLQLSVTASEFVPDTVKPEFQPKTPAKINLVPQQQQQQQTRYQSYQPYNQSYHQQQQQYKYNNQQHGSQNQAKYYQTPYYGAKNNAVNMQPNNSNHVVFEGGPKSENSSQTGKKFHKNKKGQYHTTNGDQQYQGYKQVNQIPHFQSPGKDQYSKYDAGNSGQKVQAYPPQQYNQGRNFGAEYKGGLHRSFSEEFKSSKDKQFQRQTNSRNSSQYTDQSQSNSKKQQQAYYQQQQQQQVQQNQYMQQGMMSPQFSTQPPIQVVPQVNQTDPNFTYANDGFNKGYAQQNNQDAPAYVNNLSNGFQQPGQYQYMGTQSPVVLGYPNQQEYYGPNIQGGNQYYGSKQQYNQAQKQKLANKGNLNLKQQQKLADLNIAPTLKEELENQKKSIIQQISPEIQNQIGLPKVLNNSFYSIYILDQSILDQINSNRIKEINLAEPSSLTFKAINNSDKQPYLIRRLNPQMVPLNCINTFREITQVWSALIKDPNFTPIQDVFISDEIANQKAIFLVYEFFTVAATLYNTHTKPIQDKSGLLRNNYITQDQLQFYFLEILSALKTVHMNYLYLNQDTLSPLKLLTTSCGRLKIQHFPVLNVESVQKSLPQSNQTSYTSSAPYSNSTNQVQFQYQGLVQNIPVQNQQYGSQGQKTYAIADLLSSSMGINQYYDVQSMGKNGYTQMQQEIMVQEIKGCQREDIRNMARSLLQLTIVGSSYKPGNIQLHPKLKILNEKLYQQKRQDLEVLDMEALNKPSLKRLYSDEMLDLFRVCLSYSKEYETLDVFALLQSAHHYLFEYVQKQKLLQDFLMQNLFKESENGRLFRLITQLNFVYLNSINQQDQQQVNSDDQLVMKLFMKFLFSQNNDKGQRHISWGNLIEGLNKVDAGVKEEILLASPEDNQMLIVAYDQVKQILAQRKTQLIDQK